MVGLILGATVKAGRLRELTHPLRDAFGAIFFFHFGLSIEPGAVLDVGPQVALAVAATVVLTVSAGLVAAMLHGYDRVQAANIGLAVLTRGEFSLVIAALALAAGLDPRIGPFAAGYVLVLAIVGPIAVANSGRLSRLLPSRLFAPPAEVEKVTPTLDLEAGGSGSTSWVRNCCRSASYPVPGCTASAWPSCGCRPVRRWAFSSGRVRRQRCSPRPS